MKKYGVEYITQVPEFREKMNRTLLKNGSIKTSSQQIELHKIIQEKYPDAILNYPCGRSVFDIAILIDDNTKINIEYDGWYWHQNQLKDIRRDFHFRKEGWKILRIKSANKLPSIEEIFEAIDYLINTEHHYKEIKLDDWKDIAV